MAEKIEAPSGRARGKAKPKYDVRLLAAASRECVYVAGGQPPECREEWPGEPWQWCGACLASAVLAPPADSSRTDEVGAS